MKHKIDINDVSTDILRISRDLYKEKGEKFEEYIDHLLAWNKKINLVSRTVSRETVREHVVHSLLPISLNLMSDYSRWIDAGSGGGLPGIPISIAVPKVRMILNDNVKKKMMAVDDILLSLALSNVSTIDKSISLVDLEPGTGIVSKHAFKIPKLIQLLNGKPWEKVVLWKGVKDVESELAGLNNNITVTVYRFDFGTGEPFYEGKGLVVLRR